LLVQLADNALVRPSSLQRLLDVGVDSKAPVTLLTARLHDPTGYGRVQRGPDGSVMHTVEDVDATPEQRAIDEIWAGSMLLWTDWLWDALERLPVSPKGEYYLPELVNLANAEGLGARAAQTDTEDEAYGINDRAQLARATTILRRRTVDALMSQGVTIVDPETTYIEPEVQVEADAVIQPGCHLLGHSRIAREAEIGPNSMLRDSEVGVGSRVWMSVLEGATVGDRVNVGPFSHLRPGTIIEDEANVGNYAEVKASRIGAGTQMHHFSYVGDAEIGRDVNIGAGTITANFDSESRDKSQTVVGDHASIGSDTILVAPVNVGRDAITGAGAVVTHDIPAGEVWIGAPARRFRERQQPSGSDPA
jgi:bifunctional UDP-N-acetylglucosamine pyrophosphorylase/glucosamine-1-phosphate N-acetyltransferase